MSHHAREALAKTVEEQFGFHVQFDEEEVKRT